MSSSFWHWWILAALLILLEVVVPGFVFIWLATGAFLTGVVLFVLPEIGWELQLLNFAVLGFAALGGWLVLRRRFDVADDSMLNRRGAQHVGQVYRLVEPIRDGRGRAQVGDGSWVVTGPDLPVGARVQVVAVENTVLVVEAADDPSAGGSRTSERTGHDPTGSGKATTG